MVLEADELVVSAGDKLLLDGEDVQSLERETIVFRQQQEQGRWLACHEHLSAMPEHLPPT